MHGNIALVTGGTRSVGKGIALGLGEAGVTVYVTGRSITDRGAAHITDVGGQGIAVPCDHSNDTAASDVFGGVMNQSAGSTSS